MKKLKPILVASVFSLLAITGLKVPAQDLTAEETSPINITAKELLEDHKAEVEAEKAAQDEKCREMYENRIEDYKIQAETSLDRVAKNSQNAPKGKFIGGYELTAYIATGNRCASGVYPSVNHTVACNSIPLGTKIYIEGYGEYVVEDTGGMAGNVIDIFVADYGSAIQFGRRTANVYVIED
ncbi:3D (Asp-Asp-Asp) domain-containing protein [Lachnospiraceae bacterium NE2001]|nr:3D (Asp-Asp-Asp) domain-containing protein [Lachnospiraceae bacterium NE2001]